MPWSLKQRDGKWCVVKDDDGEVEGCHASRTDAIKQQRALYASERRVASMYAELDAQAEEVAQEIVEEVKASGSELVKIEVGDQALTASLLERMDAMSQREAATTEALVAALHAIGTRESVVNVAPSPAPNVTVEAAPPAEVQVDVHVPEQPAPNVSVSPEIIVPESTSRRKVTFVRDPLTRQVEGAEITEE